MDVGVSVVVRVVVGLSGGVGGSVKVASDAVQQTGDEHLLASRDARPRQKKQ